MAKSVQQRQAEYYSRNKEKRCAASNLWKKLNPDRSALQPSQSKEACAARMRKWRTENPDKNKQSLKRANALTRSKSDHYEKKRAKHREKLAVSPEYRIWHTLRARLKSALRHKGIRKCASTLQLLRCTPAEACKHIESLFQPGMTWENRGEWHIDHIRPLASFDMLNPEHQRIACHYLNLQPLWGVDNLRKGDTWQSAD